MRFGTPRSHRARVFGKIVLVLSLLVSMGLLASGSSAAEDPDFPGLPDSFGHWIVPRATGINYAAKAKQWVRVPAIQGIVKAAPASDRTDMSCRRLKPYESITTYTADMFLVSPAGAPEPYGYYGPFTARTVAFGSIPVEASIRLRQARDAENLPTPIAVYQEARRFCPGLGPNAGPTEVEAQLAKTTASGPIEVEITSLQVDGVDLRLRGSCHTAETELKLSGADFFDLDPNVKPDEDAFTHGNLLTTPYFAMTEGGLLTGDIDIPGFTACVTSSGEDVSALLTAAMSGPHNRVKMRSEAMGGYANLDGCAFSHTCEPLPDLPLPERDD